MSPMPAPPPLKEDPVRIEICKDAEDLARHAAGLFVTLAGRALGARRQFSVALAGGQTPRRMYEMLAQDRFAFQVVWPAVQVFWSDERCVAPDHSQSNYRMAHEALLSKVGMPPGNVHRMRGEEPSPQASADGYESMMRDQLGESPRLDLALLGMGADGHTASLFPSSPALAESRRIVAVTQAPDGIPRLTLTLPAINAARVVAVLVSGTGKAETLRRVLGAESREEGFPIQWVKPETGQLVWILDEAAASLLDSTAQPAGPAA